MKINPNGFREYDARWLFEKDIDIEGVLDLGKGLGTQIVNHTKKKIRESLLVTIIDHIVKKLKMLLQMD